MKYIKKVKCHDNINFIEDELDKEMMNFSSIGCTIGNLDTRSKTR